MQRIFISLEFKYSLFLLERITSNGNPANRNSLLILAQDILDLILNMWSRRDFMVDFQWQFTWVVSLSLNPPTFTPLIPPSSSTGPED